MLRIAAALSHPPVPSRVPATLGFVGSTRFQLCTMTGTQRVPQGVDNNAFRFTRVLLKAAVATPTRRRKGNSSAHEAPLRERKRRTSSTPTSTAGKINRVRHGDPVSLVKPSVARPLRKRKSKKLAPRQRNSEPQQKNLNHIPAIITKGDCNRNVTTKDKKNPHSDDGNWQRRRKMSRAKLRVLLRRLRAYREFPNASPRSDVVTDRLPSPSATKKTQPAAAAARLRGEGVLPAASVKKSSSGTLDEYWPPLSPPSSSLQSQAATTATGAALLDREALEEKDARIAMRMLMGQHFRLTHRPLLEELELRKQKLSELRKPLLEREYLKQANAQAEALATWQRTPVPTNYGDERKYREGRFDAGSGGAGGAHSLSSNNMIDSEEEPLFLSYPPSESNVAMAEEEKEGVRRHNNNYEGEGESAGISSSSSSSTTLGESSFSLHPPTSHFRELFYSFDAEVPLVDSSSDDTDNTLR